jgi:hypothetical protein
VVAVAAGKETLTLGQLTTVFFFEFVMLDCFAGMVLITKANTVT